MVQVPFVAKNWTTLLILPCKVFTNIMLVLCPHNTRHITNILILRLPTITFIFTQSFYTFFIVVIKQIVIRILSTMLKSAAVKDITKIIYKIYVICG